jgi:hypothetical protein
VEAFVLAAYIDYAARTRRTFDIYLEIVRIDLLALAVEYCRPPIVSQNLGKREDMNDLQTASCSSTVWSSG